MSNPAHRFRMAMAKHLGKIMTPEMAAAIEVEAFHEPEQAISRIVEGRVNGYFKDNVLMGKDFSPRAQRGSSVTCRSCAAR